MIKSYNEICFNSKDIIKQKTIPELKTKQTK